MFRGVVVLSLIAGGLAVVAYVNNWAPFAGETRSVAAHSGSAPAEKFSADARPTSGSPGDCRAYSVFIDPTTSTRDRVNYKPEMDKFMNRLHSCDSVRVGRVADRTSDEAWVLPWQELPVADPNAGVVDDTEFKVKYRKAKSAITRAVDRLLAEESPALSTDVLGLLLRLSPDPGRINVLTVLSDGLDTKTIENACITKQSIQGLLDKATARLQPRGGLLAGFREVFWVMPTNAGRQNCNALQEQRLFWPPILEAEAAPGKPGIHFDTNVF